MIKKADTPQRRLMLRIVWSGLNGRRNGTQILWARFGWRTTLELFKMRGETAQPRTWQVPAGITLSSLLYVCCTRYDPGWLAHCAFCDVHHATLSI